MSRAHMDIPFILWPVSLSQTEMRSLNACLGCRDKERGDGVAVGNVSLSSP